MDIDAHAENTTASTPTTETRPPQRRKPRLEVDEDGDGEPDYADNLFDSIIAIDLDTGAINWANRIVGYDVWHVACLFGIPNCPSPFGADADFGQSPIFFKLKSNGGKPRRIVGVEQKSGIFWLLDALTGEVIWNTRVSPGGLAGGLQWGSAYDGEYLCLSSANSNNLEWTLVDGTGLGCKWRRLRLRLGF